MNPISKCAVTGKEMKMNQLTDSGIISDKIKTIIRNDYPDWDGTGLIDTSIVNKARDQFVENILRDEKGELNELDKEVLKSISSAELMSKKVNTKIDETPSTGERIADRVATFGGSWKFIIIFVSMLIFWIALNAFWLSHNAFDPYPFILLNLILSCVAALQAPVIMMSQNRQEAKDRIRSENDYLVNLKAELEIRLINEKIDHMLIHQQQRLFELQQIQIDMMSEMMKKTEKK